MSTTLESTIETAFDNRQDLTTDDLIALHKPLEQILRMLEHGEIRVAEQVEGKWHVNQWIKKAVLLYFRASGNQSIDGGYTRYFDKVPCRWGPEDGADIADAGVRVVPPATVRRGAYLGPDVVLMPSYVNIGAYVGASTMVDTWATVGSCAQIGARVHLSGGVGIGGVLEPLQASPTIIEDDCFIGARSEVVEGVIVEKGSVLSMGVFVGQSTPIYNRATGEVTRGRIPAGSVIVPGSLPAKDGTHSLNCAVIVKQVDERTRAKVSANELLRGIEVR